MKRVFVILSVLAVILSLPWTSLMAQEAEERPGERERQESQERRAEGDEGEVRDARRDEDVTRVRRRIEEEERARERQERLYEKLFAELERQRREIHALREEVAALRRMLEDQYASRRLQRDRRRRTRQSEWEMRQEPEYRPLREPREPERRDIRHAPEIEGQIRETEAAVERNPDNVELRMRLGHLYLEVDKIEAAIKQYKAALKIAPDFDPPYRALRELGYEFPDKPRDREVPLKDSVGEVISANEEEVKLKTLEGDVVTFRVPSRQKDDGSWVLNEDFSEMAKSLDPGARVKILWRESEGRRIIRRMEKVKE